MGKLTEIIDSIFVGILDIRSNQTFILFTKRKWRKKKLNVKDVERR
jgi:hypothetical protein